MVFSFVVVSPAESVMACNDDDNCFHEVASREGEMRLNVSVPYEILELIIVDFHIGLEQLEREGYYGYELEELASQLLLELALAAGADDLLMSRQNQPCGSWGLFTTCNIGSTQLLESFLECFCFIGQSAHFVRCNIRRTYWDACIRWGCTLGNMRVTRDFHHWTRE